MAELFHQLGIDWRLLLSQAANFLLLLIALRLFAYKPIMKILKDRRWKIEDGLLKAKEADNRLHEANEMARQKMKATQEEAMHLLRDTEVKAKDLEAKLLDAAREKEAALLRNTDMIIHGKAEEARREMHAEAAELVKRALVKAVELDPQAVDEALIKKAVESAK